MFMVWVSMRINGNDLWCGSPNVINTSLCNLQKHTSPNTLPNSVCNYSTHTHTHTHTHSPLAMTALTKTLSPSFYPSSISSLSHIHSPHAHVSVWLARLSYQTAPIWVGGREERREKERKREKREDKGERGEEKGGRAFLFFFLSLYPQDSSRTEEFLWLWAPVQKTSDPFTSALLHLSCVLSSEWTSWALAEVSTCDCMFMCLWLHVRDSTSRAWCY